MKSICMYLHTQKLQIILMPKWQNPNQSYPAPPELSRKHLWVATSLWFLKYYNSTAVRNQLQAGNCLFSYLNLFVNQEYVMNQEKGSQT